MAGEDLSKLKIDKTAAARPFKRRKYSYIVAIGFLIIIVVLYLSGVLKPAIEVEATNVMLGYPSQSFTLLNASGYVVAQRKASVASKITGRLEWIGVEEGTHVKKGQIIARLEGKDALASKNQAAANLEKARAVLEEIRAELEFATLNYNRKKELLAQELISKTDYDSAESAYKKAKASFTAAESSINAAKAALNAAEVAVEYALIRAPFDAVVLTKNADIGDIITPLGAAANAKAAVVTIADMSSLQVEVDVSESNIEKVKQSQPCEIQLDAIPGIRFQGEVHMVVPTADRSKASVMVKIKFLDKDNKILPEMSAKVAFLQRHVKPEEKKPRILLNPAAILNQKDKKSVFLIKENYVMGKTVVVGGRIGDVVEILEGLNEGDRVVLKPVNKMRNGLKVKIAEK